MRAAEARGKFGSRGQQAQLRVRRGARGLGRGRRVRRRGALRHRQRRRRSDLPWDACRDRPVRTLSGGQQKRFALELLLRGTDEVLLLDEPDNFLDVPGQALAGGAAARVDEVGALRLARPGAAGPDRRPGGRGRGRQRLDPPGRLRLAGTRRGWPGTTGWTSCAAAGTRSTRSSRPGADVQAEGRVQRRHGLALPGRADPAAQVRGGRPAAGAAEGPGHPDAAARRADRQAGGHLRAAGAGRT